jgi:hypothetical protein
MQGRFWLVGWLLLLGIGNPPAVADDGAMYGVGGSLALMKGHPTVRMVSEEVKIRLPEAEVEAQFVLRNEGPATWVTIGFPETGGGADFPGTDQSSFTGFRSTVDGKPVRVSRVIESRGGGMSDYHFWWVKRVHFARGQTRVVVNRYTGELGFDSGGHRSFTYVLKTGASWKGSIGRARITCDVTGLKGAAPLTFRPEGGIRTGDRITWDLRDLNPNEDIDLYWLPGFHKVRVNGTNFRELDDDGEWTGQPTPEKRETELWASARLTAGWLGAKLQFPDRTRRRVRFTCGERWAEVTADSRWLTTANGRVRLPAPARIEQGTLVLPVTLLAGALGAQAGFSSDGFYNVRTAASNSGSTGKK